MMEGFGNCGLTFIGMGREGLYRCRQQENTRHSQNQLFRSKNKATPFLNPYQISKSCPARHLSERCVISLFYKFFSVPTATSKCTTKRKKKKQKKRNRHDNIGRKFPTTNNVNSVTMGGEDTHHWNIKDVSFDGETETTWMSSFIGTDEDAGCYD